MRAWHRCVLLALLLVPHCASAEEERIVSFDSRIEVHADGSLAVTETIAVVAGGDKIQRGIYRDFPTVYDGPYGTRVVVPFRVVSVQRDGRNEPYHVETIENGERAYFGDKDVLIQPGPHTYVLRYQTSRQLGFFPDHDELYWNVTGNGWDFPIERAAASVALPSGIPPQSLRLEGYTGPAGAKGRAWKGRVDADGTVRFETTAPLDRYEGLTIVASFAKGFVLEPTREERRSEFFRANPVIVIGAAGLALVLLYYLVAWLAVGRDPKRATIIPRFEPPLGFAPACLRYVREMGYDERCFTAALVSMAAKGWLTIEEKDGDYVLVRAKKAKDGKRAEGLSIGERQVSSRLLSGDRLELKSANHTKVSGAIRALRDALALEYEGKLFLAHRRWLIPGLILSILCVLAAGLSGGGGQSAAFLFMCVWLSGWSFGTFAVVATTVRAWRALFTPGRGAFAVIGAVLSVLFTMLFAVPMLGGLAFGIYSLSMATSVWIAPLLVLLIGVNYLFLLLLKQPTRAGRAVMDEIDGFKMYLETAEGEEIAALAGPPKTRELFERLLPYAIALDVENRWAEKFTDVLAAAAAADGGGNRGYHPAWYSGDSWSRIGTASMLSSFGSSLAGAVSSASTAPGSSSGSGGGGSSGGGGGGGGGGGW